MLLAIPRVKPLGWSVDEVLTSAQVTQLDLNISLLDARLDVQNGLGLWNWRVSPTLTPGFNNVFPPFLIGCKPNRSDLGQQRNAMPCLFGSSGGGTNLLRSHDGIIFGAAQTLSPAFAAPIDGATGAVSEMMIIGSASTAYAYSVDHGVNWATSFDLAATGYLAAVGSAFIASQTHHLFGDIQGGVNDMLTLGGPFTRAVLPSSGGAATVGGEFATNGTTIVYVVQVAGHSYSSIYYSNDAAASWVLVGPLGGRGNVVWSAAWGSYIVLDDAGTIKTSPDGITWTTAAGPASSAARFQQGRFTFAAAGRAICKYWRGDGTSAFVEGVGVSSDLGQSWNVVPVGAPSGSNTLQGGIAGFNNRIYGIATDRIWQSDAVALPLREI